MTCSSRVRLMISWLMDWSRSSMLEVMVDFTNCSGTFWGLTMMRVVALYSLGA